MERFRGNNLDPEILEEGECWLPYIDDIFTPLIDSETGDFIHFPYSGSYMEQPYRLMRVLKVIQMYYKRVRFERVQRMRG